MSEQYQKIQQTAAFLQQKTTCVPKVVLVLGSGLGAYADKLEQAEAVPYASIPNFVTSTVEGHKARLVFGTLFSVPVAIMQGRFHYYEGYDQQEITFPLRVLREMGAEILLLTNAAGGICPSFVPGDLMVIRDHINFSGQSPLRGENVGEQGLRFPDMSQVYDEQLNQILQQAAEEIHLLLKQGVYIMFSGPQFETPAEIRLARAMGADAVGMSTVPEAIVAKHCGYRVCGVSCITNMAAGLLDQPLTHTEVMETGEKVKDTFSNLVDGFIKRLVKA